jgi:uridine kinase
MRPFFVAVAGPSGSGKSHLAQVLVEAIGPETCGLISMDSYYKDLSHLLFAERQLVNFDHPSALDEVRWASDLESLCRGESARIPIYDFTTHTRAAEERNWQPKPVVMIEGLFALTMEPATRPFDLRVYLDVNADTCLARRVARDVVERGRDEADVRMAFEQFVRPSISAVIEPQKVLADLVLDGTFPEKDLVSSCMERLPAFRV